MFKGLYFSNHPCLRFLWIHTYHVHIKKVKICLNPHTPLMKSKKEKEKETKEGKSKKHTHKYTNKQKNQIYVISLVRWLGWVFDTHERQKDRFSVIITIPILQSTINLKINPLQNHMHVSKVHCGSAFEPGASGLPYYCTPPVCVPDVIGALAVWWQNNQKKQECRSIRSGAARLDYHWKPLVCVPVIGALGMWWQNTKKYVCIYIHGCYDAAGRATVTGPARRHLPPTTPRGVKTRGICPELPEEYKLVNIPVQ